jgi:phenylpropionate dioxygenase-like ring-hydroxylating dioxygenase large terminal subunit
MVLTATLRLKRNFSTTITPFSIRSSLRKSAKDMAETWPIALAQGWHPVAYADEIKNAPVAVTLMDQALVICRTVAGLGILEDRCPHRNAPLSVGQLTDGQLSCPYHGWQFAADGTCVKVPGASICPAISAKAFPVVERAGLIWTSLARRPPAFPDLPPEIESNLTDGFWWRLKSSHARMLDAIENLLDPMHSYFLHPGLVRSARKRPNVTIDFTTSATGCTARYTEDRRDMTWLQRLSEGNRTHSYGRYFAPNIVQIAFEDPKGMTATISVIFCPERKDRTRPFTHFATRRARLPAWLKRWFIIAFHTPVIAQDRAMLRRQAMTIERHGGPVFANGPIDWFGPVIWTLVNGRDQPSTSATFTIAF